MAEQGKLSVTKNKKGKITVEVFFEKKGKQTKFPVQNSGITDLELDGKEVEFERENGLPVKISCEGNVVFSKEKAPTKQSPAPRKSSGNNLSHKVSKEGKMIIEHTSELSRNPAAAPYNFIPLNDKVVTAEPIPDFDRYDLKRKTGYIDLEIETKTPLYIRDSLTGEEFREQQKAEAKKEKYVNSDFFGPAGKLRIPGSSIRGMVRTLIEITGFGWFEEFDDKKLYLRSFFDASASLKEFYVKKMTQKKRDAFTIKPKAGYLQKNSQGQLTIQPATELSGTTYFKVEENLLVGQPFYPEKMSITKTKGNGKGYYIPNPKYKVFTTKVHFRNEAPNDHQHSQAKLYYGKVTDIDCKKHNGWQTGFLVCTGWVPSKRVGKHMHWVITEKDQNAKSLAIGDMLAKSYADDVSRLEDANLLKQLEKSPNGVPCFYIVDDAGEVVSFGHTGMFRLAYEKTIGEHVPENLRFMRYEITPDDIEQLRDADVPSEIIEKLEGLEKKIFFKNEFHEKLDNILKGRDQEYRSLILKHAGKYDIAQAIFGNTEAFSGRVFFEDAFMSAEQNPKDVLLDTNIPQILGTPKPTTFQHYLVQESDDLKNLSHYNDNTSIRGNKMYWHQPGKDWVERRDDMRSKKNITTKITPVKEGNRFQGRIRFENLSEVELGALLFALELPEGCFHKLGMGKPIGLGSVEIRPKLHISDRRKRYENLFYEWEKENSETDDTSKYKKEFEQYVLQQIGESNGELWKTDRLYELKIMLNFRLVQSAENRNKVRYMQIEGKNKNEYKERPVLPKPSRIRN